MAESVFGKKQVSNIVRDEINARTGKQGIIWSAKRFPWIHITSLSSVPSKYNVLTSRTTARLYETDSNKALRPKPAVTDVTVKKQGELGTTRKATISITCFTDLQLEELQKAFFIPGVVWVS